MSFLRKRDYFTEIREADLDDVLKQISQSTSFTPTKVREENEKNTQEVVEAMIRHRYDVVKIFKEILTFNLTDTFQINDLVEYSEPAYVAASTFASGDRVSFSQTVNKVLLDDIFEANQSVAANESPAANPEKWDKKTENFSLFFALKPSSNNLPDTSFAFTTNNFTGNHDLIDQWDKTRTIFLKRIESSIKIYYTAANRNTDTDSIGIVNFDPAILDEFNHDHNRHHFPHHFPHQQDHIKGHHGPIFDPAIKTFPTNIPILFGTDGENSLSGNLSIIGFIPIDQEWDVVPSNFFVKGDNRSRFIRKILVNLAIFELHKLINPRNIPDLRGEAKDDAMGLLRDIKKGTITPELPIFFEENKGQNITFNSNPKLRHQY